MASRMNGMKLLCASITVAAAGWWPWADDAQEDASELLMSTEWNWNSCAYQCTVPAAARC
jgi:hypothetical protein